MGHVHGQPAKRKCILMVFSCRILVYRRKSEAFPYFLLRPAANSANKWTLWSALLSCVRSGLLLNQAQAMRTKDLWSHSLLPGRFVHPDLHRFSRAAHPARSAACPHGTFLDIAAFSHPLCHSEAKPSSPCRRTHCILGSAPRVSGAARGGWLLRNRRAPVRFHPD